MADNDIALARRLFLHVKDGGSVTAMDLSRLVAALEKLQRELDMWREENLKKQTACEQMGARITGLQSDLAVACSERDRLAADLAEAHKAILPWIDDVGWLNAQYAIHTAALREAADEIAAYVDAEYGVSSGGPHPAMVAKYNRDMDVVHRLRALLTEGGR